MSATGIEAEVCADIAARQQAGIKKYGTTVAANPLPLRDWLQHAYEEALDMAVYLKRAISEIESECISKITKSAPSERRTDAHWPARTTTRK